MEEKKDGETVARRFRQLRLYISIYSKIVETPFRKQITSPVLCLARQFKWRDMESKKTFDLPLLFYMDCLAYTVPPFNYMHFLLCLLTNVVSFTIKSNGSNNKREITDRLVSGHRGNRTRTETHAKGRGTGDDRCTRYEDFVFICMVLGRI